MTSPVKVTALGLALIDQEDTIAAAEAVGDLVVVLDTAVQAGAATVT